MADDYGNYPLKGEEESFCPGKDTFEKSVYFNARLLDPCGGDATSRSNCYRNGRKCDGYRSEDPMDYYGKGYGKYNKRTQKMKHGSK